MIKTIQATTLIALMLFLAGCPEPQVTHTMRVVPAAISLGVGESQRLTASSTDSEDIFQWSSNAPGVATVSQSGLVTAVAEGNAIVTVRASHSMLSKTVSVAVPGLVAVTPATLVLRPTRSALLTARSSNSADTFTWRSSNTNIATVDPTGIVTAIAEGDVQIEATGSRSKSKSNAAVTVLGSSVQIDVTPSEIVLQPLQSTTLTATSPDPEDTFIWSSSNTDVAVVDANGVVTAVAEGDATIVAVGTNSIGTGNVKVTVVNPSGVEVSITPAEVLLQPGRTAALTATSTDVEDMFTWSSSRPSIATVDPSGVVTAVAQGTAAIVARGTHSGTESSASITVTSGPAVVVNITPGNIVLRPTRTALLSATSTDPEDTFTWTSDADAVTVNENGIVTAVSEGMANVTATGSNSGAEGVAQIAVAGAPPADITLTPVEIILHPNQTTTISAESTDGEDTFTWFSSDNRFATVNAAGIVTAVAEGQASIVARGSHSGTIGTAAVTITAGIEADVTVSPPQLVLRPTRTATLSATSTDATDTFTWESSNTDFVTVDGNGVVTAVADGDATVTATGSNSGNSGSSLVRVATVATADVAVSPSVVALRPTQSAILEATSTDILDTFTWSSSNTDAATVDSNGRVTAIAVGETTIIAQGSNSRASSSATVTVAGRAPATITVNPDGILLRPTLTAMFTATSTDEEDGFTWSSSDTSIATVDANGRVTAIAEGGARIRATGTLSGDVGSAIVNVSGTIPATIRITPLQLVLRPTRSATLSVTSTNVDDAFTWDSSHTDIATVDADGKVTAIATGETTVVAGGTVSGATGAAFVTVTDVVAATIDVSPAAVELEPTQTATLSATSTDAQDSFTWSSSNNNVATVSATGVVTAVAVGDAAISARGTTSGSSGSAFVRVISTAPAEVTIMPAETTIRVGESATLTATSTDSQDTFTWTSLNSTIASVNGSGVVTGVGEGSIIIQATGSRSGSMGSATVTVSGILPMGITVTPSETVLRPTQTVALSAVSTDSQDTFTWSSSEEGFATVSAAGVVTAVAEGEATITATGSHSEFTGTATVSIEGRAPAEVFVTPDTLTLRPAESMMLSAESTDIEDTFVWTSSAEEFVTVSPIGLVTGIAEGEATITATGSASGDFGTATVTIAGKPFATIVVNPIETALRVGEMATLSATSTDEEDGFTWSTSANGIATVDQTGKVVATGVGIAEITATGTASGDFGVGIVTVGSANVSITSSLLPLPVGTTETFRAISTDPNDGKFYWSSLNTNVATITDTGLVLAVNPGVTTIKAIGNTSGSAGLVELTVVPSTTSFLIWDGERGYDGGFGVFNGAEAFRGDGCFEANPTEFHRPSIRLNAYPSYRKSIEIYDEIWFFAKSDLEGRTFDFVIRSFAHSSNSINIDPYIAGGSLDTTYRLVRIPTEVLKTPEYSLAIIDDMTFGLAKPSAGHKIFIDEIWAVSLEDFDPDNVPLMGSTRAVNFGEVAIDSSSERTIPIANVGTAPLFINAVSLTGPHASEFSVSADTFVVPPGDTYDLVVTFTPDSVTSKLVGDKAANLRLVHTLTPMGSFTTIPLSGRGLSPAIELSTDSLNFGSTPLGITATRKFTLSNPGNMPLTVSSFATTDGAFAVTPGNVSVPAGESRTISVTFTPASEGAIADTLTIESNATGDNTVTVALAATGLAGGATGALAVETTNATSSTVSLVWPEISTAASVTVYMGPEPAPAGKQGGSLPLEMELDALAGNATAYTAEGLAAAADTFFHVEVRDAGNVLLAQGNAHARTVGGPRATLDNPLRQVHLVAPNIIQLVISDRGVHSFSDRGDTNDGGIDMVVGSTGALWQAGPWFIQRADGSPIGINAIHRQSFPVAQPYYVLRGSDTSLNRLDVDHRIYLVLNENIGAREILHIDGPPVLRNALTDDFLPFVENLEIDVLLPFSDDYLETNVLQVNQVGYSARATERYAYISAWMGSGGPLSLNGFPSTANVLIEPEDPLLPRTAAVSNLAITLRSAMDAMAGTEVRQINLSTLPPAEGTIYRVQVPGVGVSWQTQVSNTGLFRAFYVTARGLYHNRWGRDLQPQWTDWSPRPPDHETVYTANPPDWSIERAAFNPNTPMVGLRTLQGGHHDAGDFDIRPQHYLNAMYLMTAYELQPEAFTDGQLTIPESGNGIPDALDEVLWSLAAWEQLQEPNGGVRAGAESYKHPSVTAYADENDDPYWTFAIDAEHTFRVAALFAQCARLIQPFDAIKAAELEDRAIRAYDFALDNGITDAIYGPWFYAAGELYRLTGDTAYQDAFEALWLENDNFGTGPGIYRYQPFTIQGDNQPLLMDYIMGYLLDETANPQFVTQAKTRLSQFADEALVALEQTYAHRNARPTGFSLRFGNSTIAGQFVMSLQARLLLGGLSPSKAQDYINGLSLSADFTLGCNPMGMSWTTGLGTQYPREPLQADSLTFLQEGLPAMSGIPVYGPAALGNSAPYDFGRNLYSPTFESLPPMLQYGDLRSFVSSSEFTCWETQSPQTRLLGSLLAPDMMPPESWLPGRPEHRATQPTREDATATK